MENLPLRENNYDKGATICHLDHGDRTDGSETNIRKTLDLLSIDDTDQGPY